MLLRAGTRQTRREDQGDHEAHGTSGIESVSISYLLSVVMLCPNLVGMNSLHINLVSDLHWRHQIRQCSTQCGLRDTATPKFRGLRTLGYWALVAGRDSTNVARGDISAVDMDGVMQSDSVWLSKGRA